MDRNQKQQAVDVLHAKMARAVVGVVTQLNGIDVATVTELRKQLRGAQIEYRVVKNTIAQRAAKGTSLEGLIEDFKGPVALAMSYADPVTPAKVLSQFIKTLPPERAHWLKIKSGIIDGRRIDANGVKALATLPSLPELQASLAGLIASPATKLVRLIATPAQQLARVVEAGKDRPGQQSA